MRLFLFCALLGMLLAGCGRKTDLDLPPGGERDSRVEREWKKY